MSEETTLTPEQRVVQLEQRLSAAHKIIADNTYKLGTICAMLGIESDQPVETIKLQLRMHANTTNALHNARDEIVGLKQVIAGLEGANKSIAEQVNALAKHFAPVRENLREELASPDVRDEARAVINDTIVAIEQAFPELAES